MIPRLPKGFTHPMTIGEGSFSAVYRARQKILDRWVAIKVLREPDPALRAQLLEEARTQARLDMPCVPAVYDAFASGQRIFLVMEWVKGVSLQAVLGRGIPAAGDRAALAAAVVAGLAELHRRGFAHRDLKPANILISGERAPYLVDFGFAKKIGEGAMSMAGVVKGTPAYMAPEIWRGSADPDLKRADLYSLGKILAEIGPGDPWKSLVESLLSPDPAARPESATELWRAWQAHPVPPLTPGWKAWTDGMASQALAKLLLQAARELLLARRHDEAYWLLAECLQEDPDYSEALKLMEGFPKTQRGPLRDRRVWAVAASATLAAAVSAAFFLGRAAERESRATPGPAPEVTRTLLLPARGAAAFAGLRFREGASGPGRFAGRVFLERGSPCDSIRVDGAARAAADFAGGIPLKPGEHLFLCRDASGHTLRAEKASLLPFQRKILGLRPTGTQLVNPPGKGT